MTNSCRSWLGEIELQAKANSSQVDELVINHFAVDAEGFPYVETNLVPRFYGLPHNTAWKRVYDRQFKDNDEFLPEFSIRQDIQHRFFKDKQHIRFTLVPGSIVFELGAYLGYYTINAAKSVGSAGKVRAVELMPEIYDVLKKNLQPYADRTDVINVGVANSNSTQITYSGGGQRNGLRKDVIENGICEVKEHHVSTLTIDALCEDVNKVDLCILQLNGTEQDALEAIKTSWTKIMNFAIAANYDRDGQNAPQAIATLLKKHGYVTEVFNRWVYAKKWENYTPQMNNTNCSPIFIGGCGRSGTTLLRVMLDSHPNIACGPESNLMLDPMAFDAKSLSFKFDMNIEKIFSIANSSAYLPDFMNRFMYEYANTNGKARWAEKTPRNVRNIEYILSNFPEAYFVHVIRDGRDVACSLKTHPKWRIENGQRVANDVCNPIEQCIERWVQDVEAGIKWRTHPRYIEIRYEALISEPEKTLRQLFEQIGEKWAPEVLEYYLQQTNSRNSDKFPQNKEVTEPIDNKSLGRWKEDLSDFELKVIKDKAGSLLQELDYIDW